MTGNQPFPGISEMLKALTAQPNDPRRVVMSCDGTVTVTGYTPDEVDQVLVSVHKHMASLSELARSADTVHYSPPDPVPETFTGTPFSRRQGLDDARPR